MNPIYTRIAGNLAYSMAFVVLLIVAGYCYPKLKSFIDIFFNPYPLMYFSMIISVLFGVFVALPEFYKKVWQTGIWSYDWIRFLVIGLPAICIAFMPAQPWATPINDKLYILMVTYQPIPVIAGVLFGYVALMSLEKRNVITAPEDKDSKYNQRGRMV